MNVQAPDGGFVRSNDVAEDGREFGEREGAIMGPYTLGDWYTKPGNEDQFVEAWKEFAEWTSANVPGTTFAKLLQDRADSRRFVSFGPWRDEDAVAEWRSHPGFRERVERLEQLLESFVPRSMSVAVEVGPATPDPW